MHTAKRSKLDLPRPDYRGLNPDVCAIIARQLSVHCNSKQGASKLCYTVLGVLDCDAHAVLKLPAGMDFRRAFIDAGIMQVRQC